MHYRSNIAYAGSVDVEINQHLLLFQVPGQKEEEVDKTCRRQLVAGDTTAHVTFELIDTLPRCTLALKRACNCWVTTVVYPV